MSYIEKCVLLTGGLGVSFSIYMEAGKVLIFDPSITMYYDDRTFLPSLFTLDDVKDMESSTRKLSF